MPSAKRGQSKIVAASATDLRARAVVSRFRRSGRGRALVAFGLRAPRRVFAALVEVVELALRRGLAALAELEAERDRA
jgi:hypothetical protein